MNINTISTVISREYATRVKKKSFLVTTFLVPVLFAAMCCIPALILLFNKDEVKVVAVVDQSGIVMPCLESTPELQYADLSKYDFDSLKAQFTELEFSALLHISEIDSSQSVNVSTYSVKPVGTTVLDAMESRINDAVQDYRIRQYDINNLKDILEEVKPDIDIKTYSIDENGEDKLSNTNVYMILSILLGLIIFMFVTMFSSSVMQSVIEEKQSKVVEVLLSSVDAVDLMFGKIIGVALVALTQFLLWIVLTAAIVTVVFSAIGKDKMVDMSQQSTEMVSTMGGMADPAAVSGMDMAAQMPQGDISAMQEIIQTLTGINLPQLIISFLLFFIFGYLLYASLFAAIGSAVENAEDSNQLQVPLTVPLMIGYFIAIYAWKAPDSALSVWGSMIPFTSPIVMLTRIPFGVPDWQLWLSIALLILTFALMAWISAKIYKVGILTSGKKATYKDLWRWLRQK